MHSTQSKDFTLSIYTTLVVLQDWHIGVGMLGEATASMAQFTRRR